METFFIIFFQAALMNFCCFIEYFKKLTSFPSVTYLHVGLHTDKL